MSIVLFMIGSAALAGFFPPPSPGASAEEIARMFADNPTRILVGCLFMIVGVTFFGTWGVAVAARTRRMERGIPVLTYLQVAFTGMALFLLMLIVMLWGVAAFRPDELAPDTTRMLNDLAWFIYEYDWPPFAIWCIVIAVAIFRAPPGPAAFPRWVAYLNIWCATLYAPGSMMPFFKSGPFAYDGILAWFVPLIAFFIWITTMTVQTIASIKREEAEESLEAEAELASDEWRAAPVAT